MTIPAVPELAPAPEPGESSRPAKPAKKPGKKAGKRPTKKKAAEGARRAKPARVEETVDLESAVHYLNRELSWLQFNARVLDEALDRRQPLLERLKFLSIFASNLDEFFMIRVSGLRRQLTAAALKPPPDGMSPAEQLAAIRERLEPLLAEAERCWNDDLVPELGRHGIRVLSYDQLKSGQKKALRRLFKRDIFPALTPLAFDPAHPFPHVSNLSINLAVVIDDPVEGEKFARVKVPQMFPRLLPIPSPGDGDEEEDLGLELDAPPGYVWLEEVVAANLDRLFRGYRIAAAYPFRVTRDADIEIEEDEAADLLDAMEVVVGQRHFGSVVRLEIDRRMPASIRNLLTQNLQLAPYQVYAMPGRLGKADLAQLTDLERPELKEEPFQPVTPAALGREESIFSVLRRRDLLLYHPYDSFRPVVDFVRAAAEDPDVLAIKQTLYRVGPNSPIVEALGEARENGKQVSVLVELKARFDEENNIVWARALERAGVHVVYGMLGLKTHAKMCLVVRREPEGIRRYVHLGTGNYNPVTARIYTDLGFFTSDAGLAADVSSLFNALTGYSRKTDYRKLLVAPQNMRRQIIERIEREIVRHREHGGGYLAFKMNSLVDKRSIEALYRASIAGVKVDLQVRGICCLRPGVEGVSENIRVTSVVGRFLEHTRVFYFRNGGEEEILAGSADLMPRNLDGRVETLFPIEDPRLLKAVRDDVLFVHLADTVKSAELGSDGEWRRRAPAKGAAAVDSQRLRLAERGSWYLDD